MPETQNFLDTDIENPGKNLDPIIVENDDNSAVKIVPYHLLEGGTHKMVSCVGMFRRIPREAQELIESTTGNTGYAAAVYAKRIGIPINVYMPEGMDPKKIKKLEDLQARVIQTPRIEYTGGARTRAQAYFDEDPGTRWFLNQAKNPGNWQSHEEVSYHLSDVDELALMGGTCGAIVGLGRGIKENHRVSVTQIDLDAGPHFYNKKHSKPHEWRDHGIVGAAPSKMSAIGEEFYELMGRVAIVNSEECEKLFKEALSYNLDTGKSSIVNLVVAAKLAKKFRILVGTVTYDHADRYTESNNADLSRFSFGVDNISKFLRSEVVKLFSIHLENLK